MNPRETLAQPTQHAGKKRTAESRVRVRYAETDQMGVAYHTHFFIWFEVGRVEFLRKLGFSYRQMEQEDGCFLPVVDARCRYKSPARYDDEIVIHTRLKNMRGAFLHFTYEARRVADGALLAEGETTHIVTDAQIKACALPEKYQRAFESVLFSETPGSGG